MLKERIMYRDNLIIGNNVKEKKFFILKIMIIWPSLYLPIILFLFHFEIIYPYQNIFGLIPFLLYFPLLIIILFSAFILSLLFFTKCFLLLFNLIHDPKEGLFKMSLRNSDYLFYVLRNNIKNFVLEIFDYFPLPWAKILPMKLFNITIPNSTGMLDSYIDNEFIIFGKESILGEGSMVLSSTIINGYLLIKKTIIGDRVTIGAYTTVSPGTIVEPETILGMGSYTKINQKLERRSIYVGRPAHKIEKIENDSINNNPNIK
ncbi:MAG: hypothetical protein GF317_22455 [Candidatus Lokiarchaeota archaeon]|nr:hypothetical protein [Candidatus Lokiarchaeota archaeon]MBD3202223.1 hypothetical protein [Candidatus Lokiarchaeota archaeon]